MEGWCLPGIYAADECCVESTQHTIHTLGPHHNLCTIEHRKLTFIYNKTTICNNLDTIMHYLKIEDTQADSFWYCDYVQVNRRLLSVVGINQVM